MKNMCCFLIGLLILINVSAYTQCPLPIYPQPGNTCIQAPIICEDMNGYCSQTNIKSVPKSFPGCPGWQLGNDDWFAFIPATTSITIQISPSNCSGSSGMHAGIYAGCGPPWQPMDLQCSCTKNSFILESNSFVVGDVYYLVIDGCTGSVCDYVIDVLGGSTTGLPPNNPGPITGPVSACLDSTFFFSIDQVVGATKYNWVLLPSNAGIITGAGSQILVDWSNDFSGQVEISVTCSNECFSNPISSSLTVEVLPGPVLATLAAPKIFLQGPFVIADQLMHDSLRVNNLIPLVEPYSGLTNFTHVSCGGSEQIAPTVLSVTGPNALVDWVFLELRSAANPALVVATRSALVQRDGDIVDVDGVSPVFFGSQLDTVYYYLAVRHRNHLGVQLGTVKFYPRGTVVETNFTVQPPEGFYSQNGLNPAQRFGSGKYALWAGNGRIDTQLKYNGSNNDKNAILTTVGISTPNNIVPGYRLQDYNLDGVVKYNGSANDRNVLLGNVGILTPSAVVEEQVAR